MKKILKYFFVLLAVAAMIFAPFAVKSQTVILSGATNPYVKYNFLVGDTLKFDNTNTGTKLFYQNNTLRFFFGTSNVMRIASDGALSISDNNQFDQQLPFNISHDGVTQDGGINSTTFSATGYGNTFTGRLAGGSASAPLVTPINAKLAEFTGKGYTGAAFSTSNRAAVSLTSAQTYSLANQGTRIRIQTTPLNSSTLTNAAVFEENGSFGVTPNDTLNETYPSGFDITNARWIEITATGTGSDAGLFAQNRSMVEGFQIWHDASGNTTYYDDMLDNAGSAVKFRVRTLGTPIDAITISGTGDVDYQGEQGYTLQYSAAAFNPADATVYYIGGNYQSAGSTAGVVRIYIPKAGQIKYANFFVYNGGTLGTSETSTAAIRLNNTIDVTISSSVTTSATTQNFSNNALSTDVVEGDYIEVKWTAPTYATNPTSIRISGTIYIQ